MSQLLTLCNLCRLIHRIVKQDLRHGQRLTCRAKQSLHCERLRLTAHTQSYLDLWDWVQ